MKKCFVVLLTLLTQVVLSQPSRYRVEQFTGQDGLSMNGLMHISQDEKGFIWFRTDEGIVKYDGYSFSSYAQNPRDPDALFQKVDEIYDDQRGNIWVNYNGLGLSYLDKSTDRFVNFKADSEHEDHIGNHDVQTFHADSNFAWIGTDYGLYAYSYDNRAITYEELPASLFITSLFADNVGNLWIGTDATDADEDGIDLYLYEVSKRQLHPIEGDPADKINEIFQDSRGRIWLGTDRGVGRVMNYSPGVAALSDTYFKLYTHNTGTKQDRNRNEIISIVECANGQLWFSTNMGIARLVENDGDFELKYYLDDEALVDALDQNIFTTIFESDGTLWALSRNANLGVCRYSKQKDDFDVRFVASSNPKLEKYELISMFIDRNSVMWIGTVREGLLKLDLKQKKFKSFSYDPLNPRGLSSNKVYEITEQSNGMIWIGTANGVCKFDPQTEYFECFNTENTAINDDMVYSTLIDIKGNLWLGHWPAQVSKIDLDTWANTPFKYIVDNDTTGFFVWTASAIEEDKNGNIWFGSHKFGVWKAIGGERVFENYRFEKNEFNNPIAVETLYFDANEKLWIGTSFGLYTFNAEERELEFVEVYEDKTLFQEGIYCVTELGDDMWIGTYAGGLVQLNTKDHVIKRFDKGSGLSGNTVRGILSENDQYLWLSTTTGLSRFDIENEQFKNYTKEDGIQGNEFNVNSYYKSSNNTFYFGGTQGLTMFKPEEIADNPYPAIPQLTGLKLFHEHVVIGDTINGQVVLPTAVGELGILELNHKNKILTIEFSSMHTTSPTKNRYRYKLEGLEEEWNVVDAASRSATYTSLPAGDYVFRLMATNNDGIWSENEATLNISVLPPWWNSLPFRIAFVLLLVGLALALFRLRIMSVRLQNKKLEAMVEEKTESLKEQNKEIQHMSDKLQEAAQAKIGFFMNVSHEFRTPLALILGPAANLYTSPHLTAIDRENVRLIERNGHRLLRLTNQLLDSADLERGTLKLKVAHSDIVDFVRQIVHAFDFRADSMGVNYQFVHNENEFFCWFDGDKLEKILYNLISNAFKFTEHPAEITVDLHLAEDHLKITVTDNGIGLTAEATEKVFDRFYQVDNRFHRRTGTGIGLNLAKQLAQKHKGDLSVRSEPGKGSSFILEIPVGEAAYPEEDRAPQQTGISAQIEQIKMLTSNIPETTLSVDRRDDSKPTILHVEDSVDMRAYMKSSLEADYCVIQAKDGMEGLKKAEELVPDLIISDIMMPAMDGIEFCDKIKGNDYLSHIPIILLTAKIGEESKIKGYGVGADEYLSKPLDLNVLKARIDNLLISRNRLRESFSSHSELVPKNLLQDRGDEAFLEKAVKIVEQNLSDPELSYHAFVKSLGVGKTQLYNRINKVSGQSINIFIRTIRLKIAARMIRDGTMTFSEIAYAVGFSDPNYFSKCFKKQYGVSPKAFQQKKAEKL